MSQLWRINVQRLGRDLSEASELAAVLHEVAPHLQVEGIAGTPPSRTVSSSGTPTVATIRRRLAEAQPLLDVGETTEHSARPCCAPICRTESGGSSGVRGSQAVGVA